MGDGGPGERCNYEWAAEKSRKQEAGRRTGLTMLASTGPLLDLVCVQGSGALGTRGVDLEEEGTRVGRAAAAAAVAAISASLGIIVLLGLGLC